MRAISVEKSRKDQGQCGKCGDKLPVGCAYRYVEGRFNARKVRCMKQECAFRQSDLQSSDKLARAYAAQETCEDALGDWSSDSDLSMLQEACSTAAEELREVAQEYADAAEALGGAGEACQEKADALEGWADEIDDAGTSPEEFEASYEDTEECPECGESADHEKGHGEEGHYLCSSAECAHAFKLDEVRNGYGQTREEWAEEVRSTIQAALENCPL